MKPRTSFSATAAVPSSKYGSNNNCGGSSINTIFSPIGITTGPVKEGLVSQIASKFQQQVGVASSSETEIEKISAKRKTSEPIRSVHKFNSSVNSEKVSNSGDHLLESQGNNLLNHSTSIRKLSANKSDSSTKNNRSDSHQARFHNARAMFEKMGSADDLDSIPPSPTSNFPATGSGKSYRALSVGSKPALPEPSFNSRITTSSILSSNHSSNSGIRSRSISPFGGSRSSSQSSLKQNNTQVLSDASAIVRSSSGNFSDKIPLTSISSPSTVSDNSSSNMTYKSTNGDSNSVNGSFPRSQDKSIDEGKENVNQLGLKTSIVKDDLKYKSENQEESEYSKFMESKLRKTSDYRSPFVSSNSDDANGTKTSIGSIGRPNIKELTNKQRNWFSNFERGKTSTSASTSGTVTPENVESARRTSVKQDNIPNLLSGFDKHGTKNEIVFKGAVPDATPTPSSNLNQPGDRRPINVLTSSSDSIEDYIKSWKGDPSTNSMNAKVESVAKNIPSPNSSKQVTPQSSGPSSLNSDCKATYKPIHRLTGSNEQSKRSSDKTSRPPVLSPKPNPDVVKRFSFNKNKPTVDSNLSNSPSQDKMSVACAIQSHRNSHEVQNELKTNKHLSAESNSSDNKLNDKSDTPKKGDKTISGSIVRKLSEEYNSKIKQEDQIMSKSNDVVTGIISKTIPSVGNSYLKKNENDLIMSSTHNSKNRSKNHNSIIGLNQKESNNIKSNLHECEETISGLSVTNGHKTDKANVNLKCVADTHQGDNECDDIDKEFDSLANDAEYCELDIVNEIDMLGEKTVSEKRDTLETKFEPQNLKESNEGIICSQKENFMPNISNLNNVPETVPYIDANGSNGSSAKEKLSSEGRDDITDKSKPNKLDLQLQTICRPTSGDPNAVSNGYRTEITSTSKFESPSNTSEFEEKSSIVSDSHSPNITNSCSVDTVLEKKSDNDQELSGDEFQDEIHFDPTISSGHLGFDKEGDFRNTPITVGGTRDAITTPSQMEASYIQSQSSRKGHSEATTKDLKEKPKPEADKSLPLIMSPQEEENLLSNNIIERKGVLSDEQAEEVKALLTPDKELPPLPNDLETKEVKSDSVKPKLEENESINDVNDKSQRVDSAIDKLDSLVYSAANESNVKKCSETQNHGAVSNVNKSDQPFEDGIIYERPKPHEETYYDEAANVHYYSDGHYWFEIPGLDSTETANLSPSERLPPGCYKKPGKLRFSTSPMKQYSTFAVDDYDRRNDDVDPVAASGKPT